MLWIATKIVCTSALSSLAADAASLFYTLHSACNPLRDIQILSRFRPWEELTEDAGLRLVMGSSSKLRILIREHHIFLSLSPLVLEFKFPVDSKQHWKVSQWKVVFLGGDSGLGK